MRKIDKKPVFRVLPVKRTKSEKAMAKALEQIIDYQWEQGAFQEVLNAIISARSFVEGIYGIKTPDRIWERITEAIIKRDIKREAVTSK